MAKKVKEKKAPCAAPYDIARQAEAKARAEKNEKPDFWITRLDEIDEAMKTVKLGKVTELLPSAGGRKIYMVEYGTDNVKMGDANLSSALGAHNFTYYADKTAPDYVPTLFLVGCVHGGEFEGTATMMNLIKLMETGTDYAGNRNDKLVEACKKLHLILIPMANPDGRAHIPFDSFVGHSEYDLRYWNQGTWKDGSLCGWPGCKKAHPIKNHVDFLGGYYNDDGINLMHDFFFGNMSNETKNILDICSFRAPDISILLHGGTNSAAHFTHIGYVSGETQAQMYDLMRKLHANLALEKFPSSNGEGIISRRPEDAKTATTFNLNSAMHHCSGTPAIVYECNQGITDNGYYEDEAEIYRTHTILFETVTEWMLTPFKYDPKMVKPKHRCALSAWWHKKFYDAHKWKVSLKKREKMVRERVLGIGK